MPPFVTSPIDEQMFHLLKHDWVWDFFFDSEDVELDMLQCAFAKETLLTMEIEFSTVEHMETYSKMFNLSERHKILFLPSFTTGAVTVGFAVSCVTRNSSTLVSNEIYLGRIARDDDNGSCLFISEQYNDNCTEVSYFSMLTSSSREARFNLFKKNLFREFITFLRQSPPQFDEQRLKRALIFSYHSFDARPCPTCGAQPAKTCSCKLQIKRKRHPRDDEREMTNMVSYTGGFKGVACVQVHELGVPLFTGNFLSTSNARQTFDGATQHKLGLWAIRQAASSRYVNPLALMMSTCVSQKVSTSDTLLLASLADSVSTSATIQTDVQSDRGTNSSYRRAILPADHSVSKSISPVSEEPTTSEPGKLATIMDSGLVSEANEQEEHMPETDESISETPSPPAEMQHKQPALREAQQSCPESFSNLISAIQSEITLQRPVLLAPAITTQLPMVPALAMEDPELAMRRKRAEMRRERNRESAQRSNLKRKIRMQKLKDEIAEMSSREMYLRAREKILREENVSLRMALTR